MKKITSVAIVAIAMLTGCGTSAGSKPLATHANTPAATTSGIGELTGASACAQFRAAANVMSKSSPTNPAALKQFAKILKHLSSELSHGPAPYPRLSTALGLAGVSVLAIAHANTPHKLRQAFLVTGRYLGAVHLACAAKGY